MNRTQRLRHLRLVDEAPGEWPLGDEAQRLAGRSPWWRTTRGQLAGWLLLFGVICWLVGGGC